MERNHVKALIVAFYLSKFDKIAYEKLKLGNYSNTHKKIGEILNVNSNSVKNMRDEFDPYHSNHRAGWYQRPLRPSRQKVFDAFSELEETSLRAIVVDILRDNDVISNTFLSISNLDDTFEDQHIEYSYSTRGITGERAEQYFRDNWKYYYSEYDTIEDTTKDGCGYDFLLSTDTRKRYVEVKGRKGFLGGILLTSKEWETAIDCNHKYDLFIVSNIEDVIQVKIITNPADTLQPMMQAQPIIQVNWIVPRIQIDEA